jgi:futalosine hydrolase
MHVLLTSATPFEIGPAIEWLEKNFSSTETGLFTRDELTVQLCVTGIGMVATSWQLAQVFARIKPDFVINAGIAGALDRNLQLGDVVYVATDCFADLGVEDADGRFIDLFGLGLSQEDSFPFQAGKLVNPGAAQAGYLPHAQGISVNKAHGSEASIAALRQKFPEAQVESMEGAAFFYACLHAGVAFAEIRSVSNYVEPRNREAWNLPLAIGALHKVLVQMLEGLSR